VELLGADWIYDPFALPKRVAFKLLGVRFLLRICHKKIEDDFASRSGVNDVAPTALVTVLSQI
jgi:hypothetical protein